MAGVDRKIRAGEIPASAREALSSLFSSSLSLSKDQLIAVKYTGKKPFYSDCLYGTGTWISGQEKAVSIAVAEKLLKHPDVFQRTGSSDAPPCDHSEESPISSHDDMRTMRFNQLQTMQTAEELREFSRSELSGWEPDRRFTDPAKIRELVSIQLGVVGKM